MNHHNGPGIVEYALLAIGTFVALLPTIGGIAELLGIY